MKENNQIGLTIVKIRTFSCCIPQFTIAMELLLIVDAQIKRMTYLKGRVLSPNLILKPLRL